MAETEDIEPGQSTGERMLSGLLASSHRLHPDELLDVVRRHASVIGATDVDIYLVDHEQRTLVPVPPRGQQHGPPLSVDDSRPGRAFRDEETIVDPVEGEAADGRSLSRLWLPLLDGAERLGVVGVTVAGPPDDLLIARCHALAAVIAELVITKTPYNDGLANVRRSRSMTLPAEMRWDTLPPLTWTSERVVISGLLEPAYDVAGDTFDYSINHSHLDFALFDAVGHDLEAARIADLAVATYRNARRGGHDLQDLYRAIDRSIAQHVGNAAFATGHLARLNMDTGELRWVNAGHPAPMLLRNNAQVVDLDSDPNMPLGLGKDPAQPTSFQLEPDDRLLFFTDGMIEARSPDGEQFGRGRLAELFVLAAAEGLTHPETTRRLTHAILDHQGTALQDDATIVLLAWNGPPDEEFDTPTP